jgi:hypothetical protein
LLASHYITRQPVPRTIHEHALFYRHFGAQPAASEPADHVLNELSFLIRLDELLRTGADSASLVRARRDFLTRQAVRWIGKAADAAAEKHLPPVYCVLLALLSAAVGQDLELSEATVAAIEREKP